MPNNATAITANFTYIGGGGNGGGTGNGGTGGDTGGGGSPAEPSETITANGGSVSVGYTQEGGKVTLTLPDTKIREIIGKAQDGAASLDLSGVKGAESAILNVKAARDFSDAALTVTIKLPDAEITLAPDALALLAGQSDIGTTPITVTAAVVPVTALTGMQTAQVKGYGAVISIDVFVGEIEVDVPMTVSLPYALKADENPAAVCAWHLGDNAALTRMDGRYDEDSGFITFEVNHQSYYVAGYDPVVLWENVFSDVSSDAWYYDAAAYANYHGLFVGSGGKFMPSDSMTRAMFVTVLWNLEGKPAPSGSAIMFGDVADGLWYSDAVNWAAENSIVGGVGGGRYAPDRAITRQEMAVMLMKYARFKGYALPDYRAMPAFGDAGEVADWAVAAVEELTEAGVMGANADFMPTKSASRAEVAQTFKNFLRFIVGR
jgi:hypothetical protein